MLNKNISRVILGGAGLRTDRCDLNKCLDLYNTAFENGINTFDTAVIYGDSEIVLGKWIEEKIKLDKDFREKIVIITKGAHWNVYRKRLTKFDILTDLHDSLAKSKLNYFDIYLLHRDDINSPVEPIIDILNKLTEKNKIKMFGVSNWSHNRIEAANNYALKHNLEPIRVSSPHFSLGILNKNFCQEDDISLCGDNEAQNWYKNNNILVFPWSSLGQGFFAGRIKYSEKDNAENILGKYLFEVIANEYNFNILRELENQAEKENATVMQIALKKLISTHFKIYPIFSSSNAEHIIEAAKCL